LSYNGTENGIEHFYMTDEIPEEFVLNRVRVITVDGEYEIIVAIDGEWVRTISGRDHVGDAYGNRCVKLHHEDGDYQLDRVGDWPDQVFRTADGIHHNHGEFINIHD